MANLANLIKKITLGIIPIIVGLSFLAQGLDIFDEPIQLMGSKLILAGKIPHVDYWSFYPPLNYYLGALSFKILGESYLSHRLISIFIYFITLFFLNKIINEFEDKIYYKKLIIYIALGFVLFMPYSSAFYLMVLICFLYNVKEIFQKPIVLGLLAGVLFLFRVNFAIYTLFTLLITEFFYKELKLTDLLKIIIGFLITPIMFINYQDININNFIYETIIFPMMNMQAERVRSVDLKDLAIISIIITYLAVLRYKNTILELIAAILFLIAVFITGKYNQAYLSLSFLILFIPLIALLEIRGEIQVSKIVFFIKLLCIFNIHYFLSRADGFHVLPLIIISILLINFDINLIKGRLIKGFSVVTYFSIFLYLSPIYFNMANNIINLYAYKNDFVNKFKDISDYSIYDNFRYSELFPNYINEKLTINYLRDKIDKNGNFYVGSIDNSNIFITNMRLYYLMANGNLPYYFMGEPGLTTRCDVQRRIIEDIKIGRINYIVLFDEKKYADIDFKRRNHHGCADLDKYIHSNYSLDVKFGDYYIFKAI